MDPHPPRGLEARAVLHVAALVPVVPVHGGDAVSVGARAGRDGRGAHRRHGGEGGGAIVDVGAAVHDRGERRRAPVGHGPLQRLGAQRRRSPRARACSARRNGAPERSSQGAQARVLLVVAPPAAQQEDGQTRQRDQRDGRYENRQARDPERGTVLVYGQRRAGVGVEPTRRRGRRSCARTRWPAPRTRCRRPGPPRRGVPRRRARRRTAARRRRSTSRPVRRRACPVSKASGRRRSIAHDGGEGRRPWRSATPAAPGRRSRCRRSRGRRRRRRARRRAGRAGTGGLRPRLQALSLGR